MSSRHNVSNSVFTENHEKQRKLGDLYVQ